MAYTVVSNLLGGVDRSREIYALEPGALYSGINGHLSRGGDFEQRKAFVSYAMLPAGTFGLERASGNLYVFGSAAAPTMPSGVLYQRLQHESGLTMTKVVSTDVYQGLIYAIAQYSDGTLRHFYDGTRVTDWGPGGVYTNVGTVCKTHGRKMYVGRNRIVAFSNADACGDGQWAGTGAGFVDASIHESASEAVTALGKYINFLAVLSENAIQIWDMRTDDDLNNLVQSIGETGTRSPKTVRSYGELDMFYLSESGIRSLRSRSQSNLAGINDVGTPIDTLVREQMRTLTDAQIEGATSAVEPEDGRLWIGMGNKIFVFTYFQAKKVSGWSWYEPGFVVDEMVSLNRRVYVRSGDTIYVYGGTGGQRYDMCEVTCQLPFLSMNKPGTWKKLAGVDIAATGQWEVDMLTSPRDLNQMVRFGQLDGFSFNEEETAGLGEFTHVAPRLKRAAMGPASLSAVAVYHVLGSSES